jgi:hypothetical protein
MPVLEMPNALDRLESECLYHLDRAPEECACARTLGQIFLNSKDLERGRRLLGVYLAHPHPPDPEVEALYPRLFLR